jgi:hypothetical protein
MILQPACNERHTPVYPCYLMPTRHCPAVYDAVCLTVVGRVCARYESEDATPWWPEITGDTNPFDTISAIRLRP